MIPDECPDCRADLDGGSIWERFMAKHGNEADADRSAAMYGATRTEGRFSRRIGVYDLDKDRVTAQSCPDCGHRWART